MPKCIPCDNTFDAHLAGSNPPFRCATTFFYSLLFCSQPSLSYFFHCVATRIWNGGGHIFAIGVRAKASLIRPKRGKWIRANSTYREKGRRFQLYGSSRVLWATGIFKYFLNKLVLVWGGGVRKLEFWPPNALTITRSPPPRPDKIFLLPR